MGTRLGFRRALLGREVTIAFSVLAVLYLLRYIRFQPLFMGAYLLIVAYDLVEAALPVLNPFHQIGFPLFLYLLAVIAAGVCRGLRVEDDNKSASIRTLGAVSLIVGVLSVLFGAFVGGPLVSPTDNPTPLAITGVAGIGLLLIGWWLLRRL